MYNVDNGKNAERTTARLSSADGWNSISFEPKKLLTINDQRVILIGLEIEGKFWSREQIINLDSDLQTELRDDYIVNLPQLLVLEEGIKEFCRLQEKWLNDPRTFRLDLSASKDPTLGVCVGPRDDFISAHNRPVFSLIYSSSRMKAEWCFIVDASCIAILLEGLKSWFVTI
jgi:hypothetical protein